MYHYPMNNVDYNINEENLLPSSSSSSSLIINEFNSLTMESLHIYPEMGGVGIGGVGGGGIGGGGGGGYFKSSSSSHHLFEELGSNVSSTSSNEIPLAEGLHLPEIYEVRILFYPLSFLLSIPLTILIVLGSF